MVAASARGGVPAILRAAVRSAAERRAPLPRPLPPLTRGEGPGEGCPRVVAVTVNYNGGRFLGDFLESFRALTYPNLGLVVVDNASRDGSWEMVSRVIPEATLIRSATNDGFTGGNNRAVREALAQGADYVLFLNNDTRLSADLVEALVAEARPDTIVAPHVYLDGTADRMDDTIGRFSWLRGAWRDWIFNRPAPPYLRRARPVEMASLTALLVPAAVFRTIGFLDERMFMYYEDFDFARRARKAGFRLRQTPSARLWHRRAASSGGGETAFKYYYATRNRLHLLRRHQHLALFLPVCAFLVITRLVRAAQYRATGRPDLARAIMAGMVDFFRGRMGKTWRPPGEA